MCRDIFMERYIEMSSIRRVDGSRLGTQSRGRSSVQRGSSSQFAVQAVHLQRCGCRRSEACPSHCQDFDLHC